MEDSLVGHKSSTFLVRAAPRWAWSKFSTVHSLVSESFGLYQEEPMRRRVPFRGSEHTQFSSNSSQRRSAPDEHAGNINAVTNAIRDARVILAQSITTHLLYASASPSRLLKNPTLGNGS